MNARVLTFGRYVLFYGVSIVLFCLWLPHYQHWFLWKVVLDSIWSPRVYFILMNKYYELISNGVFFFLGDAGPWKNAMSYFLPPHNPSVIFCVFCYKLSNMFWFSIIFFFTFYYGFARFQHFPSISLIYWWKLKCVSGVQSFLFNLISWTYGP